MPKTPKNESITPVKPSGIIYQLKITLKAVKPPIWRRLQVKSDITLLALHKTIQKVMGWTDSHLHEFIVKGVSYGDSEDEDALNERRHRLNKLRFEEKEKFFYVYDFGDNWEHVILVEKILSIDSSVKYPVCLAGKRSGPIENCGGPWGYMELLDILGDPNHPEHEEQMEWIEEDFDPEMFDVDEINGRLRGRRR
jgi:Plasmid pRiA4b ORF-3-like protein